MQMSQSTYIKVRKEVFGKDDKQSKCISELSEDRAHELLSLQFSINLEQVRDLVEVRKTLPQLPEEQRKAIETNL